METPTFENEQTLHTHRQEGTVEEFDSAYEEAIGEARGELGDFHPLLIGGERVETGDSFAVKSPGDDEVVIGEFASGDEDAVNRAVEAASESGENWRRTDVEERAEVFREAAERFRKRKYELAATLTFENGKGRVEAMAEVDESIDFLRFYSREVDRNNGYDFDTGEPTPGQNCRNVLRPYGVFGVVGPFNFPIAIFTGMTTGALVTGNTAVTKPASATPLIAHKVVSIMRDAGVPDGVVNLITGGGKEVGDPLVEHDDVGGFAFTGSRKVGTSIEKKFREMGKRGPVIAELGGKNPVVVTAEGDIEKAVEGIKMGAFSFSGQKCSATSRVYVHESVFGEFTGSLVEETEDLDILQPHKKGAILSPIIDGSALERYEHICELAREDGEVLTGGNVVKTPSDEREPSIADGGNGLPDGRYVEPTVVEDIPHDHELARDEHFLPFVTLHPISSLDEGIRKSNDSDYGLCAGLFTEDADEAEEWFERIDSGMCYVNRSQSATTGALVGSQPFGGWKFSGTTGKFAGGYWYLPQFCREQTRTVVGDVPEEF